MTYVLDAETNRVTTVEDQIKKAAMPSRTAAMSAIVAEQQAKAADAAKANAAANELMAERADLLDPNVRAALVREPSKAGSFGVDPALARWLHAQAADQAGRAAFLGGRVAHYGA